MLLCVGRDFSPFFGKLSIVFIFVLVNCSILTTWTFVLMVRWWCRRESWRLHMRLGVVHESAYFFLSNSNISFALTQMSLSGRYKSPPIFDFQKLVAMCPEVRVHRKILDTYIFFWKDVTQGCDTRNSNKKKCLL